MATVSQTMLDAIQDKVIVLKRLVAARYPAKNAPDVTVKFALKSSRILGTYQLFNGCQHVINLNHAMLNELREKYIDTVFVHEYAHACVQHYFGNYRAGQPIKSHGAEFKHFCSILGIEGKATCSVATNSETLKELTANKNYFLYACSCRETKFTQTRHNKVQRGFFYRCKTCNTRMNYIGEQNQNTVREKTIMETTIAEQVTKTQPVEQIINMSVAELSKQVHIFSARAGNADAWGTKVSKKSVFDAVEIQKFERNPPKHDVTPYNHAARIAYLMQHDDASESISVLRFGKQTKVTGGLHRLAAAILRKDKTIDVVVSGI